MALFDYIGEAALEIAIVVAGDFFVKIGSGFIYLVTFGKCRIDEHSGFQTVAAGVLGFLVIGTILTSLIYLGCAADSGSATSD